MSHLRSRSSALASYLFEACCSTPEDLGRIARTGQLLPPGSLKYKAVRQKLAWVKLLPNERFFTQRRVRQALEELLTLHSLELPSVPGFSRRSWLDMHVPVLTKTLQRARKSTAMDPSCLETQPWDQDRHMNLLYCFHLALPLSYIRPPQNFPAPAG